MHGILAKYNLAKYNLAKQNPREVENLNRPLPMEDVGKVLQGIASTETKSSKNWRQKIKKTKI